MKKYLPVLAFLSVALASLIMAGFAYFATYEAARIKFDATADDAMNRIVNRVQIHMSLLSAVHALFAADDGDVSPIAFRTFFKALEAEKNFTGLGGIGLLQLVETGSEEAAEATIRANLGEPRAIFPATDQPVRMPVVLFEPQAETARRSIGYDMYTDPMRRVALDEAMRDNEAHATGPVQLGQATGGPVYPGFLVFKRLDVTSVPDRSMSTETRTTGVLYVSFRAANVFSTALDTAPRLPVHVEIYAGPVAAENLLFRSEAAASDAYDPGLRAARSTKVAGREWTVVFQPTEAFSPPTSQAIPLMLGTFGLLLASAMAVAARLQSKAYEAAEELHRASETSLVEKDLMLHEMKHRIKNSITRMLAIARQTAAGAEDKDAFLASFSARLQAMASSQDMLTRSRWQRADLKELLTTELSQSIGSGLPDDMMKGPKVTVDEKTTQALGLTFHELATNALKYGSVDGLSVEWNVEAEPKGARRLKLRWREEMGAALEQPEKTGFGTRLIDMNVERELGGTVRRNFGATGLTVEIEIPLAR